jgi:RND family efflux transporter MFP subunit
VEKRSDLSCLLEPGEETLVAFEVSGRILAMNYEEGDEVATGERLAQLDAPEYDLQRAQASQGLNNARLAYQQAKDFYARAEQLYQSGALAKADFENARDGLAMAQNGLRLAEEAEVLVNGDARDWLLAPFNGIILSKMASRGQLVAAGTPVYRIGQLNTLKILMPVPDYEIKQWQLGDKVSLSLYDETREASVTRIHPATNQGTGTISVEVTVANPSKDWHPGQLVQISRKINGEKGIFVPVQSVINRGESEPYVFVVVNNKAVKRSVTIGQIAGQDLEITSGLQLGEKVVSRGAERLFNGDRVVTGGKGE